MGRRGSYGHFSRFHMQKPIVDGHLGTEAMNQCTSGAGGLEIVRLVEGAKFLHFFCPDDRSHQLSKVQVFVRLFLFFFSSGKYVSMATQQTLLHFY